MYEIDEEGKAIIVEAKRKRRTKKLTKKEDEH